MPICAMKIRSLRLRIATWNVDYVGRRLLDDLKEAQPDAHCLQELPNGNPPDKGKHPHKCKPHGLIRVTSADYVNGKIIYFDAAYWR